MTELLACFDPSCPHRCDHGLRKVGRPAPRGFKGVIWSKEACVCTVRGWLKAHPEDGKPVEDVVPLGRAARAAAKVLSASPAERGSKRLGILRAELAREQETLRSLGERLESGTAALTGEVAAIDEEEVENQRRLTAAESTKKLSSSRLEALRAELSGLQAEIREAEHEIERTTWARSSFGLRRQEVQRKLAAARERLAPQEAAARKRIEKLERRISTLVAYHPELPASG